MPLLEVDGLEGGYGQSRVLFGVSFSVAAGEVVTLLGRNGMGKTTTISTIMGLLPPPPAPSASTAPRSTASPPTASAASASAWSPKAARSSQPHRPRKPDRHRVQPPPRARALDARPHPRPLPRPRPPPARLCRPALRRRTADARRRPRADDQPRLLILDEATEGLAPLIRAEIWRVLSMLAAAGQSILVIDKNVDALVRIASRHFILEKGRVVWSGSSAELRADPALQQRYLGV